MIKPHYTDAKSYNSQLTEGVPSNDISGILILTLLVLHMLFALLMRFSNAAATIHAILTIAISFMIALTTKDIRKIVTAGAYICGSEVLWRMSEASVFWEAGKYVTVAIFGIALISRVKVRNAGLPLLYIILLLPSTILTLNQMGLADVRDALSSNLSGPLSMAVCILFLSQVNADKQDLKTWIWACVFPISGILSQAVYSTVTATEIQFGSESVFVTSGGYGPNQVSAMLGLGAFLLILLFFLEQRWFIRILAFVLAVGLLAQSFLTFSRGGVVNVIVALGMVLIHLLTNRKYLLRFLPALLIFTGIGIFYVFPQLNTYTGSALQARYQDLNLTGREEIARSDIQIWLDNPILGIGPGMSKYGRLPYYQHLAAAHTEYTRMLAEHGSAGLLSLLILLLIIWRAYLHAPDSLARALTASLAAWSLVEMGHAAMRIVAISFIFGLACINWRTSEKQKESRPSPQQSDSQYGKTSYYHNQIKSIGQRNTNYK